MTWEDILKQSEDTFEPIFNELNLSQVNVNVEGKDNIEIDYSGSSKVIFSTESNRGTFTMSPVKIIAEIGITEFKGEEEIELTPPGYKDFEIDSDLIELDYDFEQRPRVSDIVNLVFMLDGVEINLDKDLNVKDARVTVIGYY